MNRSGTRLQVYDGFGDVSTYLLRNPHHIIGFEAS